MFFTYIVTKIMSIEYSRLLACYGLLRTFWRGVVSSCAWLRNPRTDCLILKMEALRSLETSITVSRHSVISLTPLRELQISLHAHCPKITPGATTDTRGFLNPFRYFLEI